MKLHKLMVGSLAGILALSATAFAIPTGEADRMSVTQEIQRLETVQANAQQEAENRPGYNGRAAREKLEQLNGIIEQLQQRKPVSPEAVDRALLR
jgi:hypothetical protein